MHFCSQLCDATTCAELAGEGSKTHQANRYMHTHIASDKKTTYHSSFADPTRIHDLNPTTAVASKKPHRLHPLSNVRQQLHPYSRSRVNKITKAQLPRRAQHDKTRNDKAAALAYTVTPQCEVSSSKLTRKPRDTYSSCRLKRNEVDRPK